MGEAYEGDWVVSSVFDDRAERFGDRVFIESHDENVTYGELRGRSQRMAGALIRQYLIAQMPRFTVPRYIRFVDELPKTPSQRIQKYKLRAEGVTDDTHDREALGIVVPRD